MHKCFVAQCVNNQIYVANIIFLHTSAKQRSANVISFVPAQACDLKFHILHRALDKKEYSVKIEG